MKYNSKEIPDIIASSLKSLFQAPCWETVIIRTVSVFPDQYPLICHIAHKM